MLTIVIPTYNEAEYLPLLLRSLEMQTFRDFEVVVADNHSTDLTREIAREHGCRIVDGGMPAGGRNRGAEAANGEAILFLDADVILPDPWFLQMTVAEFARRNLGVATCGVKPISSRNVDKVIHEVFNYFMWVTRAMAPHAPGFCIFARRDVHRAIGGFDEAITLAEDHDYAERAAKESKFGILKTYKVPVSVRRFDRDGRLNVAVKYMLCELHMRTAGAVKNDFFNYTFGYPAASRAKQTRKK
ncbi:MAG: glycosyltransferase [Patescibacteria group bacterium]